MSARPEPWLRIRLMHRQDLDAILGIEQQSYGFPWSQGVFTDCLRMGYSAWVVTNNIGDILGYSLMTLAVGEAHILNICTDLESRRQGVASFLLEHLIGHAREMGGQTMFLEVRPSNTGAVALYRRFGFDQVGRRWGYYPSQSGREDALILSLEL